MRLTKQRKKPLRHNGGSGSINYCLYLIKWRSEWARIQNREIGRRGIEVRDLTSVHFEQKSSRDEVAGIFSISEAWENIIKRFNNFPWPRPYYGEVMDVFRHNRD
jgi:hypothetical protein